MKFDPPLFHPNSPSLPLRAPPALADLLPIARPVYANGEVCISILHAPGDDPNAYESASERWSPVQSVEKILLSVISMLAGAASLSWASLSADVRQLTTDATTAQSRTSSREPTSTPACVALSLASTLRSARHVPDASRPSVPSHRAHAENVPRPPRRVRRVDPGARAAAARPLSVRTHALVGTEGERSPCLVDDRVGALGPGDAGGGGRRVSQCTDPCRSPRSLCRSATG